MVIQYASRCKGAHSDDPAQRDAFETPHPQRQRATRFDVARPAGVSTAVVSYVLNGSPKIISPDTAQRCSTRRSGSTTTPTPSPEPQDRHHAHARRHRARLLEPILRRIHRPARSRCIQTRTGADHQPVARRPARRAPPHQRTRRAQRRREFVSSAQTDAELARCAVTRARPRAHARRAAHRRRTRHQAVLRMQVTGRQVAANGSQ